MYVSVEANVLTATVWSIAEERSILDKIHNHSKKQISRMFSEFNDRRVSPFVTESCTKRTRSTVLRRKNANKRSIELERPKTIQRAGSILCRYPRKQISRVFYARFDTLRRGAVLQSEIINGNTTWMARGHACSHFPLTSIRMQLNHDYS